MDRYSYKEIIKTRVQPYVVIKNHSDKNQYYKVMFIS